LRVLFTFEGITKFTISQFERSRELVIKLYKSETPLDCARGDLKYKSKTDV